jgi:hypothetical protein
VKRRSPQELLDQMGDPLDPEVYDWASATDQPLTESELYVLHYAAHVEWGTENTFASLDTARDPVVKRFLRIWLEQEVVHANMLARLLNQFGMTVEPIHRTRRQRCAAWRGMCINQVARRIIGDDFTALHMTWGAVNELTTQRFYGVIRSSTKNVLLQTLLRDIMSQEAMHYHFYRTVAAERLANRPRAQRIVRWAMTHLWTPVGVGLRSREDADRVVTTLLAERPDVISQIDSQLNRIPGLHGVDLARGCVEHALAAA